MAPDFDTMNETDVREIIVRPLLGRLGYAHGTSATIRTEVPLSYDRAFLGRKKSNDPPLRGRADYICDVTSYGRWCIEVKGAGQVLTDDDIAQAHTYAAHPEISASHFLVTNGREFRLFATGVLSAPLISWTFEETDSVLLNVFNIVGPPAIQKLRKLMLPDVAKPLGVGLPSKLQLIAGEIVYGQHKSTHPLLQGDGMNGAIGHIVGEQVLRHEDGRICASVAVRSPLQGFAELNRLLGLDRFEFLTADEFVSNDVEKPTIFQNFVEGRLEPGAEGRLLPNTPPISIPFGFDYTVFTEATGYAKDDIFEGIARFDYTYRFIRGASRIANPLLNQIAMLAGQQPIASIEGEGKFSIRTKPF